jgi:scyllo-inositol 2-dehydrogenase (NADP+)
MNKKLKVGIVSFGYSTRTFHIPFILAHKYYELYAVLERFKSDSINTYPFIKLYRDYEEFLGDSNIELVIITTPNYTHYELAKKALLAGKNVVVDKPFVVNLNEAKELINLAKSKDLTLTVYQNRRFDGDFITVKKQLEKNVLGPIFDFYSHFDRFKERPIIRWREMNLAGSGLVYDIGSHLIDQAIKLFGIPSSIFAVSNKVDEYIEVEDYFYIIFEYNKFNIFLGAGNKYIIPRPRFAMFGECGAFIKYNLDPQENALKKGKNPCMVPWVIEEKKFWGTLKIQKGNLIKEELIETIPGNYMDFYDNLYNHIVNKNQIEVTFSDILMNTYLIEKVYKSIHNGTKEAINGDFKI